MTRLLRAILDQLPLSVLHRLHVLLRLVRLRRARRQRVQVRFAVAKFHARKIMDAMNCGEKSVDIDGKTYMVERL